MNWVKQFGIIIGIQIVSDILVELLSLPLPGTVFGMGILLILLLMKVIKIEQVSDVGDFLLSILIILYIPAGVGVLEHLDELLPVFLSILLVIILSTIITMMVTGHVVQILMGAGRGEKNA